MEEECKSLNPELKRKEDEAVLEGEKNEEHSDISTQRRFINGKIVQEKWNPTNRRLKVVNGTTNLIKDINKERSIAAKGVNTANPFDALQVEELDDGEADNNQRMDANESSKIDETMTEANAATPDSLYNNKKAHHKEVIRQEHEELDFSKRSTDKKLTVEKITKNALMGREDPQHIKVNYNKNNIFMPQAHTETPG
ncbi:hypothetical protein KY289_030518 [Solanum tuberosum]|nr:hypothetical protein KY289_030518 [Solanum tuberosum]